MDTLILALRVLVSLGLVVALLWGVQRRSAKWASKRRTAVATIEVVGKRSIGQKASVVVVDVDGTRLVLGVAEHGVSVLESGPAPQKAAASETSAESAAGDAPRHAQAGQTRRTPDFGSILTRAGLAGTLTHPGWQPLSRARPPQSRRGRH